MSDRTPDLPNDGEVRPLSRVTLSGPDLSTVNLEFGDEPQGQRGDTQQVIVPPFPEEPPVEAEVAPVTSPAEEPFDPARYEIGRAHV